MLIVLLILPFVSPQVLKLGHRQFTEIFEATARASCTVFPCPPHGSGSAKACTLMVYNRRILQGSHVRFLLLFLLCCHFDGVFVTVRRQMVAELNRAQLASGMAEKLKQHEERARYDIECDVT